METWVLVQLVAILFVGLGYVLSSGQWNVVSSGEILWIGRLPGGNEKICPCGLWELLQCRTLWAFFILFSTLCVLMPSPQRWRRRTREPLFLYENNMRPSKEQTNKKYHQRKKNIYIYMYVLRLFFCFAYSIFLYLFSLHCCCNTAHLDVLKCKVKICS